MNPSPKVDIKRQAVIIIHGMGEQRPMRTLRDFVERIAPSIQNSAKPTYYSKPDSLSENHELRRLTANEHRFAFKTDYYELYWAHIIGHTTLRSVWTWVGRLFLRFPWYVPARLLGIYVIFWICTLTLIGTLLFTFKNLFSIWRSVSGNDVSNFVIGLAASLLLSIINGFLVNFLGDVVRYMTPSPDNIEARQSIRKAGLELLRKLHQKDRFGNAAYDRVIIVGHSLGSVIAYDLINLFWIEQTRSQTAIASTALDLIETAALDLEGKRITLDEFKNKQFEFWKSASKTDLWKISDFITLGSPLAFSRLHLTDKKYSLEKKIKQREFSTCPPVFEMGDNNEKFFSYPLSHALKCRSLHHAAPFSMTRWTNIYFKNDFVGGPIKDLGEGIENVVLKSKYRQIIPFLSHTAYWNKSEGPCCELIRGKMHLRF